MSSRSMNDISISIWVNSKLAISPLVLVAENTGRSGSKRSMAAHHQDLLELLR